MTQPRRLMERGADPFERELLRSAVHDAPSKQSQHRALAALGIGAGTAVGAGASSSAAAAGSVAAGSAAGGTVLKVGAAAFVKWVGVGLVMTGAVAGGAYYATRPAEAPPVAADALPATVLTVSAMRPPRPPDVRRRQAPDVPVALAVPPEMVAPPSSAGRAAPRSSAVAASAPTALPEQAAAATLSPPVPQPAAVPTAAAPPPVESAIAAPTADPLAAAPATALSPLAAETALIDAAREAVRANQSARALRLLDERDRRFPGGAFGEEATVLRIEALVRSGDRATASDLASRFIAAHPGSPHADGLRSLTNP